MITNDISRVRLLITDVGGNSGTDFVFNDSEIETFIDQRGGGIMRGAALALRTMAANEALVSKHITFLEMKTDGATVSKELRDLAKSFEEMADEDGDADGPVIIEMLSDPFAYRAAYLRRFGVGT